MYNRSGFLEDAEESEKILWASWEWEMEIIKPDILWGEYSDKKLQCNILANILKVCWFITKEYEYKIKKEDAFRGV